MAKSRAQQAAIAIAKMKKEELTELIREALREVKEGNAFVDAARKAKEAGEEEFEFDGKVHKVQEVEASLAEEADTEIKVGNYQTKHYHICPGAKTLYQDIEDKVEDMDLAERTAKLQDALFAIEMRALEDGAVQADLDAAEIIADQIMAMAQMMGLEKEHHYIQGHIDKIKGAVENIDEENALIKTKKGEEALVDVDPTDSSVKNDPNIVSIKTTSGKKIKEMISVGHVDDEPGMLKQFAFDTAQYAAKLYKLLHHYEQMEDHVDFPNWWQHKVMMAREYMSKATHYLEFETMKPQIDAAVDGHSEESLNEDKEKAINYLQQAIKLSHTNKVRNLILKAVRELGLEVPKVWTESVIDEGDYQARTKEDLVFQYLRDAWQFGATKGKDVNPDKELSTMADSLLANLPDYDAAELDEARDYQALVGKTVQYGGRRATVEGEEGDYIRLKFEDGKENLVSKSDFENKEPYVNEDDDVEAPAAGFEDDSAKAPKGDKKLNKAASKNDKIISKYKEIKPLFKKAAAGDKEALAIVLANQDVIKAYKKMMQSHLTESKATCCGKCGRTHVKGTECKKPFLTGKDHCRVR